MRHASSTSSVASQVSNNSRRCWAVVRGKWIRLFIPWDHSISHKFVQSPSAQYNPSKNSRHPQDLFTPFSQFFCAILIMNSRQFSPSLMRHGENCPQQYEHSVDFESHRYFGLSPGLSDRSDRAVMFGD